MARAATREIDKVSLLEQQQPARVECVLTHEDVRRLHVRPEVAEMTHAQFGPSPRAGGLLEAGRGRQDYHSRRSSADPFEQLPVDVLHLGQVLARADKCNWT